MAGESKVPESLAERFWSLARGMEGTSDSSEPLAAVQHVLAVLDALDAGRVGSELTANTVNFLTLLRQHEVKGDLLYASPEQARGEQVDERSLVFSVGVLLFEKLTGHHPFGAEGNPQRLARMQRGEMASGVNYFPRVPAELRVVLLKAMGPFPEERWNSLGELRGQLEVFVGRAREPGRRERAQAVRPLPALPGGPEPPRRRIAAASPTPPAPGPPTRAPSPTPSAEIDLTRMARMTGRHSAIRVDTEPVSAEAALRALARKLGRRVVPGAWAFAGVLVGAALTSIIFLAVWPDDAAIAEQAAPAATAKTATAKTATAKTVTAKTATANAATKAATAKPATKAATRAPASTVFDPAAGGDAALVAVRACVAADRKVQFGASLHYDAESGLSRRVFFGAIEQLDPPERACLDSKLLGLPAGAAPAHASMVTYSFHLSPTGDQVKARLNPSR